MTTRSGGRVYRHAPRPLAPGACPHCARVVTVNPSGRRRSHRDSDGSHCTGSGLVVGDLAPSLVDVMNVEIVIPTADTDEDGRRRSVTGMCHSCDRKVSGERRYCGPCLVARGRL